MPSTANDNTFVVIFVIVLCLIFYYFFTTSPIHNDGILQLNNTSTESDNNHLSDNQSSSDSSDSSSYNDSSYVSASDAFADDSVSDNSIERIANRAMGRNNLYYKKKNNGKYNHVSYRKNDNNHKTVNKEYYDVPDITKKNANNFTPLDEGDQSLAPISLSSKKESESDKYNVNSFLPQEENKDWFETIETVDVKNSNLINIYRPIGVNTIGSSNKGSSYDIRGNGKAICPKFVVSPWLQSTTDPNRNTKSLC